MTAEQFSTEFGSLMNRALQGPEIPLHSMILELDSAHHKMQHMLMNFEAQQLASKIIPVNGHLPPPRR
jgi:hypothetical protein